VSVTAGVGAAQPAAPRQRIGAIAIACLRLVALRGRGDNGAAMTPTPPESLDRAPPGNPSASVIWLHGLGADGHDFAPIVDELGLPAGHGVRFVFPHAPRRAVTINGGMAMPAWYDLLGLDPSAGEDAAGIRDAEARVAALIARERDAGIPSRSIVLAGFSQGGAMALHAGLRHTEPLAGVIALSAYLPLADRLETEITEANRETPIFQAHGDQDEVLPFALGSASHQRIASVRPAPEWHTYTGMGHGVCAPEIADVRVWLGQRLGSI